MCRAHGEGGRRCTSSTPEYRREKRLEKKGLALAAVESSAVDGPASSGVRSTGDTAVDMDALAQSFREHAETVGAPQPDVFSNQAGCWATQRIQMADGSEVDWSGTYAPFSKDWATVAEVTISEPATEWPRIGGHKVGVLHDPKTNKWLGFDAKQDDRGMWLTRGQVADSLAHAASMVPPEHREALGLPVDLNVRPSVDELIAMFPPQREAVKAAWGHDRQYVSDLESAEMLGALGKEGSTFAELQTERGGTPNEWVNHAGHYATPLEGKRWSQHFTAYGHADHQLTVTDAEGNPVEFDGETVKAWIDVDAADHTGWRPVAMFKPKTSSVERKKKGARTFYKVDRHNAYGIAQNQTTGEWAVYNTTDTGTSKDWAYGRDEYTWDTKVVVSYDINKAAAHLTVQQREALGLPGNPVSTADGDANTDTRKVA